MKAFITALAAAGWLVFGSGEAALAAPSFEQHQVWEKGEEGILTYHVPTIFVSAQGTILAAADARYRDPGDFGPHHLVLKRSSDGGRTWSANTYIARSDHGEIYLFPNLIQPRGAERIFFFYAEKVPSDIHHVTRVWQRSSTDDGMTWSDPVDVAPVLTAADAALGERVRAGTAGPEFAHDYYLLYGRRALFPGPGVAIQLSADNPFHSGRLMVPILGMKDRWVEPIQRGQFNAVLVSDDAGRTWQAGGTVPIGDQPDSESSIVELENGAVLMNARVEKRNFRMLTRSADGGNRWTVPKQDTTLPPFDQIHAGLLRYSFARNDPTHTNRILISFPDSLKRENLNVWVSYDEHKSWAVRKVINPGPSFYSNMALMPDHSILLVYGRDISAADPNLPARSMVARFNLEWLTDGRDSDSAGRH